MLVLAFFSLIIVCVAGQNHVVRIYQSDFDNGTLIIGTGSYILAEDINFCPKHSRSKDLIERFQPYLLSRKYDRNAFAMGWFAAIVVKGDNIVINLNGHTIGMCKELMLLQRFFSVISLSSAPFTAGNGPHEFVGDSQFFAARNVTIMGPGTLSGSSHHLIQGNENKDIHIQNIVFENYEVAAISLNNVDKLTIEDCKIRGNRHDVPVLATYSAAIAIRPYIKHLMKLRYTMTLRGQPICARKVFEALSESLYIAFNDIMKIGRINRYEHPAEFKLFDNPLRVPEGSCYGILVYGHGPASNGFALEVDEDDVDDSSSNVIIRRNSIKDIKCMTREVPSAVENGLVVNDVRGAVLQFFDTFTNDGFAMNMEDSTYQGNILTDAQIMVASAIHDGYFNSSDNRPRFLTTKNTIPPAIVRWAEGLPNHQGTLPTYRPKYRCLGDAMHHVTKGMIGIRLEETIGFMIDSNIIESLQNLTPKQHNPPHGCHDINEEVDTENGRIAQDANIRGISVSAVRAFSKSRKSKVTNNYLQSFHSTNAFSIQGISIQGDANGFDLEGNIVELSKNRTDSTYTSLFIGINADDAGKGQSITFGHNILTQSIITKNNHHIAPHRNLEGKKRGSGACPYASF